VSDIITLLPDSVANQIAAGEVIQRPASVVKELVENSLDSGATEITINIKDAGRTLIHIIDNGCGMSPTDARMSFERHATSKIRSANDLFCIRTMGFRGEALASIAAISDVELRTKRTEDEVGTYIYISATRVKTQEPVACANGTSFMVKNLFFNIPARRKFLKSNTAELKHIINEIQRIAIPNPDIRFQFIHNNTTIYDLPKTNARKRIIDLFGKGLNQSVLNVNESTSIVTVAGFIGQPQMARKTMGEQFFFVNKRYIRHPYFHKAVMQAYDKLIPSDAFPSYFIFLETDPASIDINVHPTKTEIKFENENAIWQIIHASVRESLGKNNIVPSIDFNQNGSFELPLPPKDWENVVIPNISVDSGYNPFNETKHIHSPASGIKPVKPDVSQWEDLYTGVQLKIRPEPQENKRVPDNIESPVESPGFFGGKKVLQLKQKYILTPVKSGIMIIDQKRAHERILYEKFIASVQTESVACQQQLFPQTFELNPSDAALLVSLLPDLLTLGFDIRQFGKNTFIVQGLPAFLESSAHQSLIEKLLEEFKNSPLDAKSKAKVHCALLLAKASAIPYSTELKAEEIDHIIDELFACSTPNYTPDGKKVLTIISSGDIDKLFLR
jgi:DNA mismatch repair protein MutL